MSQGLHPGATIPDFELPDENGTLHRLSELQGGNRWCSCSAAASTAPASGSTSARC
jgi:hypothetical protein